jgi:predicted acyltransferase
LLRSLNYLGGKSPGFDLETLRFPGVLVRIALVYFCASLIVLHLRVRAQVVLAAALLLGYWALLGFLPNPHDYPSNLSPGGNLVRVVDRALIGPEHMYTYDANTHSLKEPTDPEGLLSTLPAIVTALMGYWTGLVLQRLGMNWQTALLIAGCGALCVEAGLLWNPLFPFSKKLWTSSFVLLTGGLAMQFFALCLLVFDLWGWKRLARPFEIVGINAIFVFVASGLMANFLNRLQIGGTSAHDWIFTQLFPAWVADPKLASLACALATVAFWWIVLWCMARLGISIRV